MKLKPPLIRDLQCDRLLEDDRATSHLRGQRPLGKIQRTNCHHGNCGPSLTGKTLSVSLIFMHRTHLNVKTRQVRSRATENWNELIISGIELCSKKLSQMVINAVNDRFGFTLHQRHVQDIHG